jgi:hypothetical protein
MVNELTKELLLSDIPKKGSYVGSLLSNYNKENIILAKKLHFKGINGKDVYNITAPIWFNGKHYIAGRVESRHTETDSQVMFFSENDGEWGIEGDLPVFSLQDPFISVHGEEIVLGGVLISTDGSNSIVDYQTVFFKGKNICELNQFAKGPKMMKDIRLIHTPHGLGVFTRPQGKIGGRGRIGFMLLNSIKEMESLPDENYISAQIITNDLSDSEWIGANAIYPLSNGKLGVLGHIAHFSEDMKKHYYPIAFCFDCMTKEVSGAKILAKRRICPQGSPKTRNLATYCFQAA